MRLPQRVLLTVLLLGTAGCASDAQQHAFDEWIRMDSEAYGGRHAAALGSDQRPSTLAAARSQTAATHDLAEDAALEDYLRYAGMHNPGLEAAFNQWKAALERIPQVRSLPDPRFNYRYFIENVETRVGPQRQAFGLSQTFPWFGKLALRGGVALEEARATQARYEAKKQRLFYDVKRAYYEYYYLARGIAVVEENYRLVKYLEGVARTRFKAAAAQHPDVIRAQVELGKLDDQLRSLKDLRGALAARLNAVLNRPIDTPIPWPKTIPEAVGKLDGAALGKSLRLTNPELQALQHEIAKHRTGISLAKKEYYPDITVGVDYVDTAKRGGVSPPSDSGQDAVAAGFSINLPIWRGKYDAGVRESFARFGAATKTRIDRQNLLAADLATAIYHYDDAARKIDLYRDTLVPKAQQSVKATEASFRAGQSTFIDLIDAERVLLQFQLAYERALTDGATRLAEIEMLVGDRVAPVVPPPVEEQPDPGQVKPNNQDEGDSDAK